MSDGVGQGITHAANPGEKKAAQGHTRRAAHRLQPQPLCRRSADALTKRATATSASLEAFQRRHPRMPEIHLATQVPRHLAIVTAPLHYRWRGRIWSYGPYARELDQWARWFERVTLVGPVREATPPEDATALEAGHFDLHPIPLTGGPTLGAKAIQIARIPELLLRLSRACRAADAVHVRGPANVCLLTALLAPWLDRPMVAKYAGQWSAYPGERSLVAWQRRLLKTRLPGPVMVYGRREDDPPHIVDFFTSMMSRQQVDHAMQQTADHRFHQPLRLLFAGRLFPGKGLLELIDACARLRSQGAEIHLRVVGDGPLAGPARARVAELGLEGGVEFTGPLPYRRSLDAMARADVLVLASAHEGWPKVLTEAMVHHTLCLAPRGGIMGRLLEGRGVHLDGIDTDAIERGIRRVLDEPERWQAGLPDAAEWASRYSLERLGDAIGALLQDQWQTSLAQPS